MKLYEKVLLAKKDQDYMLELLEDFSPLIKKYAFLSGSEDGQAELTASFIKMIRDYPKNFDKTADMYTLSYIKKTVRNEYIALSKKKSRDPTVYLEDNQMYEPQVNDNSELVFYDLISPLSLLQKNIILRKYYYCFSDSEIAHDLHISRQSVNRAKNRALANLKKIINN
jgi:RNA polymerase sigma factor (sigma-70 family)